MLYFWTVKVWANAAGAKARATIQVDVWVSCVIGIPRMGSTLRLAQESVRRQMAARTCVDHLPASSGHRCHPERSRRIFFSATCFALHSRDFPAAAMRGLVGLLVSLAAVARITSAQPVRLTRDAAVRDAVARSPRSGILLADTTLAWAQLLS